MSSQIDGTVAVRLTANPTPFTRISATKLPSVRTDFYLYGYQVVGASPADDLYFVTSNALQMTNADATPNLKVGNGVYLPIPNVANYYYEFNSPLKLRAVSFPCNLDFTVYNQAGALAAFTSLTLFFVMK